MCETRKSPTTCFFTQWNLHISGRIGLNAIFSPQPNASRHLRGPGAWPRSTQSRQGRRAGSSPTAAGHGHSAGCPQAPHPLQPAVGTVQATRRLLTLRRPRAQCRLPAGSSPSAGRGHSAGWPSGCRPLTPPGPGLSWGGAGFADGRMNALRILQRSSLPCVMVLNEALINQIF